MNILSRSEFRRSALLLALIVISGCLLIPGALAVTISTGTFQIDTVGNTTTIPIVMDSAPNALSGYKIQVNLSNPSVGTITACAFPSWVGLSKKSTLPAAGVVISGVDTQPFVKSTDTNILLATLTVQGTAIGSTPITLTISPTTGVQDTSGTNYAVTTPAGQLTVGTPTTPTVTATPTATPTVTATPTATPTVTVTPTATPTVTVTPTATPTVTVTPTATPTVTVTPTVTPTVTIGAVTADFQVDTTAGSNLVKITDKSVNAATVRYDLGDGASTKNMAAHGPVLSYYYITAQTYTITQTATSAGGQTATKQISVTVGGVPTTSTTPTTTVTTTVTTVTPTPTVTVTPGFPVPDFTLTTPSSMGIQIIDASTGATSVMYNLGDGTTTKLTQFRYTYWQPGTYTITLTATNAMGSSVKTVQVTVPATPVVTPTVTATPTTTVTPGQSAFNGPHNVPGTVQAEDYDVGGQNIAYMDTTAGNAGGVYRTDDVDIENGATGKAVAYVISGEYLTYSVNAATAGDYAITLNAANPDPTAKSVTISVGSSSTTVSIPSTGSFDTYNTFSSAPNVVHFVQGANTVKVAFGASRMNLDYITFGPASQPTPTVTTTVTTTATTTTTTTVQPTGTPLSTPYYIIARMPGHIESYSYDNGGEGVAYHDTTTANLGGKLRSDAVDIEYSQADAGYNIGYVVNGEWLIYSVQIDTAGTYTASIRASNPDSTAKHIVLTLEGSTTPIATVTVPSTGSFDKYTTITTTVQMPAGRHWLKLSFPESRVNLRFMDFTRGASEAAIGTPSMSISTTQVTSTPAMTTPMTIMPVPTTPVTTPVITTPVPTTPVTFTPVTTTPVITTPVTSTPVITTPVVTTPVPTT